MFGIKNIIPDPTSTNEMIRDARVLAAKKENMGKLRWSSILSSISTVGAVVGGPLMAAGVIGLASYFFGGATAAATGIASMGMFPIVATLVVGALFVGMSVASAYAASRIWQSKQFDNFEINAQSTAHHLVQELKANDMCIEQEKSTRADGKSWSQYAKERSTVAAQPGIQA
jgi:membrane protein implicated in regulation of membrane protease activity